MSENEIRDFLFPHEVVLRLPELIRTRIFLVAGMAPTKVTNGDSRNAYISLFERLVFYRFTVADLTTVK